MLKVLDLPLVLFGCLEAIESAKVPTLVRFRILFAGVDAKLSRF